MITATYPIRARRHAGWTDTFLIEQEEPATAPVVAGVDANGRTVTNGNVFVPNDLTGYTARLQVRDGDDDDDPLVATLDSETGTITIVEAAGTVTPTLTDTLTGLIEAGRYRYDLRLQPATGDGSYLIAGPFIMEPSVTTP